MTPLEQQARNDAVGLYRRAWSHHRREAFMAQMAHKPLTARIRMNRAIHVRRAILLELEDPKPVGLD